MKPSIVHELGGMRKAQSGEPAEPRTHVIWCWHDEIDTVFAAKRRDMIESGEADENDQFVAFTWRRPDDEGSDSAGGTP